MSKLKPQEQSVPPAPSESHSPAERLDARVALLTTLAFSLALALSRGLPVLVAGLGVGLAAGACARLPLRTWLKRLVPVNLFLLLLFVLLPLSTPGEAAFSLGRFSWSRTGLAFAATIALKCNAIALVLAAFLGTMEMVRLGHALVHLHVPPKLAHLLLFTVRYIDVLQDEHRRLRSAMRVRCFRARLNRHTMRTYGSLVGMLVVRSLDRSERIMDAMKCRGFDGRFHMLYHFRFRRADGVFAAVAAVVLSALVIAEWLCRTA